MATGALQTQGTRLYVAKPGESGATLIKFSCPTGVTGVGGGARDNLVVDCLENTGDRDVLAGGSTPGPISVPFTLIPDATSHQDLVQMRKDRNLMNWLVLGSDASGDPTLGSGDAIEPPADCTAIGFKAFIADLSIDFAGNDLVRGTLTLQRSGDVTWQFPS